MFFMDKSKIQNAKKHTEIKRYNEHITETVQLNHCLGFQKSLNAGIFPDICVICRKGQYVTEKYNLKHKREEMFNGK